MIRGWLHADGRDLSHAQVVVEVNNEVCVRSIILRNGRFEFSLPVGATARLVFEEPGSLTKEVLVDTRNALASAKARMANKLVKFDVVLDPVEKHTGRTYAGPVGQLRFVKGSGVMIVKHDVHLVNVPGEE